MACFLALVGYCNGWVATPEGHFSLRIFTILSHPGI
jgi:hypothetical protein